MELDELKQQLKNKLAVDHTGRSDADIAALLTKRTGSVISKLKRSLWIEIICCILVVLVFGYIGITSGYESLKIYFSVFAILSIGMLFLLVYLLKRTTKLGATILPVKSNLQTIVTIIQEFTKRYFQFTMALIPTCFIFSFLLGYYENDHLWYGSKYSAGHLSVQWKWVVLSLYIIVFSVGMYYFTKWYLKKLYGNYVAQLKECISELSEE
jgi:hypothetical protein